MDCLSREPGEYLSDIYEALEREVLYRRLQNDKNQLLNYIQKNYASNF